MTQGNWNINVFFLDGVEPYCIFHSEKVPTFELIKELIDEHINCGACEDHKGIIVLDTVEGTEQGGLFFRLKHLSLSGIHTFDVECARELYV